jgi:pseudouridine kinase
VALRVLVVGACLCDVSARPIAPAEEATSNAALVALSAGGVARNIAESLVRLGCGVCLVSVVGVDAMAKVVEDDLASIAIEPRLLRRGATGVYVALLTPDGLLERGFCDSREIEGLTAREVEDLAGDLARFDGAVLDANLSEDTITQLAERFHERRLPYALEGVSNAKAVRINQALAGCHLVKLNQTEAHLITGIDCSTRDGAGKAARQLVQRGTRNIVVSLGADGFHLLCRGHDAHVPAEVVDVVDATGAGDALLTVAFTGLLRNVPAPELKQAMRRSAALTCRSERPVSSELGPHLFEAEI